MDTYSYEELETYFEEYLNELYDDVDVCGYVYQSGSLLKSIDPIAFGVEMSSWMVNSGYEEVEIYGGTYYTLDEE